jgi:hypothetical protein
MLTTIALRGIGRALRSRQEKYIACKMNQNSRRHTFNSDGSRVLDRGQFNK